MFVQPLLSMTMVLAFFPAPRDPEPDEKGRGFFGVLLVDNGGVSITRVEPGSPAEKAGIRINDQLLAIDGQRVANVNETREVIGRLRPGKVAVVEARRGGQSVTIKLKVGARPESLP
jgi:S1-C subfamily serine protease